MNTKLMCALAFVVANFFAAAIRAAEEAETKKQPIFLMCPENERYSSWSIYATVDKKDPSKLLGIGLDELSNHNCADDGGYSKVVDVQGKSDAPAVNLGTLDAKSFGSGSLKVEKDNALNVTVTPDGDKYKLTIDLRIAADQHFIMGGSEAAKRNLVLMYNKGFKAWGAYATALEDDKGKNIITGEPVRVTGIKFPVKAAGIYTITAGLAGNQGVKIFDRR
ncbi:MAG TPA: hypothetical protein VKX17_09355 [Planctomycetota bacterium]|nr:hypothetical protein [Planctomycetota bacterium]